MFFQQLTETSGTDAPVTAATLDNDIASVSTVEELLRHLNPFTWQEDLEQLYTHTHYYRPRTFHTDRKHKRESHTHTKLV